MKVERLVIDSNVWNAALIAPAGAARQLVNAVLDRNIDILMSEAMFIELVSRLDQPKINRPANAPWGMVDFADRPSRCCWCASAA